MASTEDSSITILLNDGKGHFKAAAGSPFFANRFPNDIGIADFNGDGNLDLATDSWGENKVVVIFGDKDMGFGGETSYLVGNRPYQRLRAADLNGDGKPDIVTTNLEGNNATVLLGQGDGKFREAEGSPFDCGSAPFGVAIGDVNGDGMGKFHPMKGSPFATGKSPSRLAIGDLNGDKINDIAVTNYNDGSISIFYMGKTGVEKIKTMRVGNRPDGICIGDFNKDGKNDIVVSNFDDGTITLLFNTR